MHFSQSFAAKLTAGLLAVTGMIAPAFAVSGTVDAEGGLRLRNAFQHRRQAVLGYHPRRLPD